jgi:hypothetical protein
MHGMENEPAKRWDETQAPCYPDVSREGGVAKTNQLKKNDFFG